VLAPEFIPSFIFSVVPEPDYEPAEITEPVFGRRIALRDSRRIVMRAIDENRDQASRKPVDKIRPGGSRRDKALRLVRETISTIAKESHEPAF